MIHPVRLRLSRAKGFNLQAHSRAINGLAAINCTRPGKWGNPFTKLRVINWDLGDYMDDRERVWRDEAVTLFKLWATGELPDYYYHDGPFWPLRPCALDFAELRGRNLACWCRPDQPCHVDVQLELANR